ncbi:hypothetical protein [[Phormidium ambiguum] IAM M-71]|uniref:hypothetical protein n=1 Tax=[Phormidium ambiguum] IAM M-71 TaxID=454136 RepID=UPI00116131F0|nr:hypothetical protein [Phormidium ambiguum]
MTFQWCFVVFWEMRSLKLQTSYEMLMYKLRRPNYFPQRNSCLVASLTFQCWNFMLIEKCDRIPSQTSIYICG